MPDTLGRSTESSMPSERVAAKKERLTTLCQHLRNTYPDAHCELTHGNSLELLIATILSAQCTDKMVNRVTEVLFAKYPTAAELAALSTKRLEKAIQSAGFFRNKAKSIQACCQTLVERHHGEVPATMEELTQLAGVGRKTANVVLGNAFAINEGIVVDTHVARLSGRLDLSKQKHPEKIEHDLTKLVPRQNWTRFSHWLIWHGRRRCSARKPDCANCEIVELCPRKGVKRG